MEPCTSAIIGRFLLMMEAVLYFWHAIILSSFLAVSDTGRLMSRQSSSYLMSRTMDNPLLFFVSFDRYDIVPHVLTKCGLPLT